MSESITRYTKEMFDIARRVFLYVVAAVMISYLLLTIIGATMYAKADDTQNAIWVRDQIGPNAHHLAGLIPVKSSCMELKEKTEQLSPVLYKLKFTTWEHPNAECTKDSVSKEFYEIVFAPAVGVRFIATLDDISIPIIVVPYIP